MRLLMLGRFCESWPGGAKDWTLTGFMVEVEVEVVVGETGGAALAVSRSAEEAAGAGACAEAGAEAGIEDAGAEAGMGVDADGEMEPGETAVPG
jgi:hypothetical protein